jgi:hypothetical protein
MRPDLHARGALKFWTTSLKENGKRTEASHTSRPQQPSTGGQKDENEIFLSTNNFSNQLTLKTIHFTIILIIIFQT